MRVDTHEIAGHLILIDNYGGGKDVNTTEKFLGARMAYPIP